MLVPDDRRKGLKSMECISFPLRAHHPLGDPAGEVVACGILNALTASATATRVKFQKWYSAGILKCRVPYTQYAVVCDAPLNYVDSDLLTDSWSWSQPVP